MAVNIDTDWRGAHFSEKLQIRIEERTNGEAWPSKIVSSDISTIKRWRLDVIPFSLNSGTKPVPDSFLLIKIPPAAIKAPLRSLTH